MQRCQDIVWRLPCCVLRARKALKYGEHFNPGHPYMTGCVLAGTAELCVFCCCVSGCVCFIAAFWESSGSHVSCLHAFQSLRCVWEGRGNVR